MEKQILHIDVNNAFLSWSAVYMLENGSSIDIRDIVSVIGGDEKQRKRNSSCKEYEGKRVSE